MSDQKRIEKAEIPKSDRWEQFDFMCKRNKDFLIILADPKSDFTMVAYNGRRVFAKLQPGLVKAVLTKSGFASHIVSFLGSLQDLFDITLKNPALTLVKKIGNWFSFLDGAFFNLTRQKKSRASILTTPQYDPLSKSEKPNGIIGVDV